MNWTRVDWIVVVMALAVMPGVAAAEVRAQGGAGSVPNLLVYEGFDYPGVDMPVDGQDGGFGFGAAWQRGGWGQVYVTGRTWFAPGRTGNTVNEVGGLEFPGLPTVGSALSRYGTAGQQRADRLLAADALAELTRDDTTIWFSALLGAAAFQRDAILIFGDNRFVARDATGDPPAEDGALDGPGQGFGVSFRPTNNGSPNAVAFVNSTSQITGNSDFIPNIESGGSHHDTMLIVGKINWKPVGTPDELFLFNVTDVRLDEPDESAAIASLTADLDQSTFDRIALHDSGSSIVDEIRIGTTYGSVLGWPAPAVTLIAIR